MSLAALSLLTVVGCQEPTASTTEATPATSTEHDEAAHAHPSEGPHHGDLVELGNEEYHAEVLHDKELGTLTIYMLDGTATKQVAIDATEVTINITHDGKPEQFTLAAKPDDSDEPGKSSRFFSDDKDLAGHIDAFGAGPRLVVKIDGKAYRGEITHSHDHGEDDHGHDHK